MSESLLVVRAPTANRVYSEAAGRLAASEARWVLTAHLGPGLEVRERLVGGMDSLEIRPTGPTADRIDREAVLQIAGMFSATLGVLEIVDDEDTGAPLLRPLQVPSSLRHPDDLETIQKYPGKTNEQFTALLVNLACALSTRRAHLLDGTLALLDPLCGRGTTLNRALRLGLSPIGIEIDRKDVEAYRAFLTTWLRTHRYKHTVQESALTVRGRALGRRVRAELAADKQAQREDRGQELTVYGCDTREVGQVLAARSIDALVADLPYGVQHGSRGAGGWQRSPLEMLEDVAPTWRHLLRDGGAAALAVNRRTTDHAAAAEVLAAAGLRVITRDGAFRHRVDQSIDRDILLAVPTDHPRVEELAALGADQERTLP